MVINKIKKWKKKRNSKVYKEMYKSIRTPEYLIYKKFINLSMVLISIVFFIYWTKHNNIITMTDWTLAIYPFIMVTGWLPELPYIGKYFKGLPNVTANWLIVTGIVGMPFDPPIHVMNFVLGLFLWSGNRDNFFMKKWSIILVHIHWFIVLLVSVSYMVTQDLLHNNVVYSLGGISGHGEYYKAFKMIGVDISILWVRVLILFIGVFITYSVYGLFGIFTRFIDRAIYYKLNYEKIQKSYLK